MNITINVIGQKMTTNHKTIIEGSQKFVKFCFNLSDEWRGLTIGVQFTPNNGQPITDYLDEENCVYLPPQISEGTFVMSLKGTGDISRPDVIGTSNSLTFEVGKFIYSGDTDNPEITPTGVVMATKTYDPQGKRTDIFKYTDDQIDLVKDKIKDDVKSELDTMRDGIINEIKNDVKSELDIVDDIHTEIIDARTLDDGVNMEKLGDSLRYVYSIAKNNQGSSVQSPITVVSELPQNATNGDMCIVSLPNTLDFGVDRFVYIDWEQLLGVSMNHIMGITTDEEFNDTIFPNSTVGFDSWSDDSITCDYTQIGFVSTPKELTESGSHELYFYYEIKESILDEFTGEFVETDTGFDLYFRDGVLARTKQDGSLESCRYEYVDGEMLMYEVDSFPTRFEIQPTFSIFKLDDVVEWFYSPYRLMIYRNGWERI